MRVILKYVVRNMCGRKVRTILVITAIMISSGMFFASMSISGTLVKMQADRWRQNYGYSDIVIQKNFDSPSPFFYMNKAEQYMQDMEYIIGEISGYAIYKPDSEEKTGMALRGMDIEELQKLTLFKFEETRNLYPFKGMKIIISREAAEKYDLHVGSNIPLEINGSMHKFILSGIAQPAGPFSEDGRAINAVVPMNTLNSLYNARGKVDRIYLKLVNPARINRFIYLLSKDYTRYSVKEPFSEWAVKRETDRTATPIILVTVILSFMCIYIIHTTFKIIIFERLPVIGTFRSIGAGRFTTNVILVLESILYGLAGGIPGCGLGISLLYIMTSLSDTGGTGNVSVSLDFTVFQLACTLGIAVALAVAGSIMPVLRSARLSIKDIISGSAHEAHNMHKMNIIAGIVLLGFSIILPFVISIKKALVIDTACVIILLLAVNLLIPAITGGLLRILEFRCAPVLGNIGILAVKMLKRSKNAQTGISLLVIGISSLYMISTLNYSQVKDISGCFDRILYDITLEMGFSDKNTLRLISETDGVRDIYGSYYTGRTEVAGYEDSIWHIQGVNEMKFLSWYDIKMNGNRESLIKELDTGRNILLTNTLKDRLRVKNGDMITLRSTAGSGSHIERIYKITGFFDTIFSGFWSYALISERYFKLDIQNHFYGPVYIKTDKSPSDVVNSLKTKFAARQPVMELTADARERTLKSSHQLFLILQLFTVLTLLTGTFGILNNLIIGFLQRKRRFAMLRSSGMSKMQLCRMIFIEALVQGITGSTLGIGVGTIATWVIIPQIIKALGLEISLYFSPLSIPGCFAVGLISYLSASAVPAVKSSRLDLVSSIKYE